MRGYQTVAKEACCELIVNKSRFIGHCFPIKGEEQALSLLEDVRKRHRDATHNCYAYSAGGMGGAARFSDDGEPSGTAGQPMMEVIRHKDVTDLLIVVTRYFGGVLLGANGLVRAYSKAASMAVEAAELVYMEPCTVYHISADYSSYSLLEPVLCGYRRVGDVAYTDIVRLSLAVPLERGEEFLRAVTERTDGRIIPVPGETAAFCTSKNK